MRKVGVSLRKTGFAKKIRQLLGSGVFWAVAIFAAVALSIGSGVTAAGKTSVSRQIVLLKDAVRREAVQCYALEGSYPQDLAYLQERYGLRYDADRYVVHYKFLGGNLLPEISVFYLED
ncbi:MAG: hypothetical protein ACOX3H_02895 [Saccharofermentanales bacterium]